MFHLVLLVLMYLLTSVDLETKVIVRAMQSMRKLNKAADTTQYKRCQGPEPTLLFVGLYDLTRVGKRWSESGHPLK